MKTVFVFGAGASKDTGAPLMTDFLDSAYRLLRNRDELIMDAADHFEEVFNTIADLHAIHAKSYIDLDNIESLLGAIEMGMIIGRIGDRDEEKLKLLKTSVVTLIYKTIEASVGFPSSQDSIVSPRSFKKLTGMLDPFYCKNAHTDHELSFITFNYDVALDVALHIAGIRFSYCFKGHGNPDICPLLKLHGSINWGRCGTCKELVEYPVSHPPRSAIKGEFRYLPFGSRLNSIQHCQQSLQSPPIIVPPTWNKTGYHSEISTIWRIAADKLAEAENLFVIGYSLPETDSFFKYLYALSARNSTRLKRFWVFNPDEKVRDRFESLIGPAVRSRFRFIPHPFAAVIEEIGNALKAGWSG
jgi:hypothetical protein